MDLVPIRRGRRGRPRRPGPAGARPRCRVARRVRPMTAARPSARPSRRPVRPSHGPPSRTRRSTDAAHRHARRPRIAPDLAAIKGRQQATWASGDYHVIGTQIMIVVGAADRGARRPARPSASSTSPPAAATPPSRRPAAAAPVVGVDYVPSLLDRARRRTRRRGPRRAVPRGRRRGAAVRGRELRRRDARSSGRCSRPTRSGRRPSCARVTRPGGRIGLVAHTPEGFIGQLLQDDRRATSRRPRASRSPLLVGHRGAAAASCSATPSPSMRAEKRHVRRSATRSPEAWLETLAPVLRSDAQGVRGRRRGRAARRSRRTCSTSIGRVQPTPTDGTMVVPSEYLEAVLERSGAAAGPRPRRSDR